VDRTAADAWAHLIDSWGSAYEFAHDGAAGGAERFTATRRDGKGGPLTADTPEALRTLVVRNYFGHRVSRENAP
jgi:hypothetical protein